MAKKKHADRKATTKTDPVLALAEYWLSAEYMRLLTHALKDEWLADQKTHWQKFRTYHSYWLAGLYVVADGFLQLGLDTAKVPEITNAHLKKLKKFRNASFHFQTHTKKQAQFFAPCEWEALDWAETLHAQLHAFFRKYVGMR